MQRQFDAAETIEIIARERVTHIMLVPAQIIAILNAPTSLTPEKLASLQMILSLGAPLYKDKDAEPSAARPLLRAVWTHGGVLDHFLDRTQAEYKAGSVGRPPVFYEMRIVREDGTDAAPGEVGEIVGRGPSLMTGYFNRPDLTAQAIRDGWLFTGDLGYVDSEGYSISSIARRT
ncbi:MAG: AMP-binding protein [Burkholderiales bacterium]